ncbi:uncharacterized protein BDR25DRAFT_348483 [Lindgomyces ingoldianus]|uniref:Uncharacterized protein n=1 Tax=Lindgomyces ingoldianus TaxID=673940 RepID=A0ACB6RG20_9PLEO|nr:uncharacterized protein BDR25DRAFT_348483 [Lindgomyces ingoldianus]KAF2478228.1 hypothetical protein BDR25DRAFT_348483 [Lindgomyces ingoldianus]
MKLALGHNVDNLQESVRGIEQETQGTQGWIDVTTVTESGEYDYVVIALPFSKVGLTDAKVLISPKPSHINNVLSKVLQIRTILQDGILREVGLSHYQRLWCKSYSGDPASMLSSICDQLVMARRSTRIVFHNSPAAVIDNAGKASTFQHTMKPSSRPYSWESAGTTPTHGSSQR